MYRSDDRIDDGSSKHTTSVPYKQTPSFVVQQVLKVKAKKASAVTVHDDCKNYVLKVCGRDEYLISDIPLHHYKVRFSNTYPIRNTIL